MNMREILFRAKRKDWRERPKEEWWVYGDAIHELIGMTIKHMEHGMPVRVPVDPETLCQYICMNDKNSNWIWENDIVSCEHEKYPDDDPLEVYPLLPDPIKYRRNYAVEFVNTGSNYGYRLRNKSIHFMLTGNVIYNHKIKVIGNIFDNPELLKGE